MRRLLIAVALLMLFSTSARAETCTSSAGGTWAGIGGGTATWTGCTPSSDDDYVIANGHTVMITADVAQDGLAANTGIVVQSGGTLTLAVASDSTTERVLALNDEGLEVQSGGTFTATGRFICPGNATLTTSASPCGWMYVGNVLFTERAHWTGRKRTAEVVVSCGVRSVTAWLFGSAAFHGGVLVSCKVTKEARPAHALPRACFGIHHECER